jgi:hypothetical protein
LLSLLIDSQHTYEAIGRRFGVSKQRIGQLALIMGIDGRQRERQRISRRRTSSRNGYSADVLAVIRAIKRLGLEVLPYGHRYGKRLLYTASKQTVLINSVPCRIYCRRHDHGHHGEGKYVQFYAGRWMKGAKVAVLAVINLPGSNYTSCLAATCSTSLNSFCRLAANMRWADTRNPIEIGSRMRVHGIS